MIAVLSMLFPYLLGLGLLAALPFLKGSFLFDQPKSQRSALLGLVLLSGLHLNYLLTLLLRDLDTALILGALLSIAGLLTSLFVRMSRDSLLSGRCSANTPSPLAGEGGGGGEGALPVGRKDGKRISTLLSLLNLGWFRWLLLLYLLALFAVPILLDPISAWDARSIWFFHGKMIYYDRGLDRAAFTLPAVQFSHPDYPKLVPVLAAQCAAVAGFWNEYLPKASLLGLLMPALLGLLSFLNRFKVSCLFLAAVVLFSMEGELLWNGLMDGYLALYAGLSLLFLCRWFSGGNKVDFWCGVAYAGVLLNLKNEGLLYVLVLVMVLLLLVWSRDRSLQPFRSAFVPGSLSMLPALPVAGFILWSCMKRSWGLRNDLQLGLASFSRIRTHLAEGAYTTVAKALLVDAFVWKGVLVLALAILAAKSFRLKVPLQVWMSIITSCIYFAAMFLIYLATPADLSWHLGTSASRTMLPVLMGLFAATFVVLDETEPSHEVAPKRGERPR